MIAERWLRDLDGRGIPGVSVLTTELRKALAAQCRALWFDGSAVFVPHPVQKRTAAELHRIAEDSAAKVGRRTTSPP